MMRVGPGMVSQWQQTCPECSGAGETIKKEDACTDVRNQSHTSRMNARPHDSDVRHRSIAAELTQRITHADLRFSLFAVCHSCVCFILLQCKGRKTKPQSEILELVIPRGKQPGSRIPFYNKADEAADLEAGDIVVVLAPGQSKRPARSQRWLRSRRSVAWCSTNAIAHCACLSSVYMSSSFLLLRPASG